VIGLLDCSCSHLHETSLLVLFNYFLLPPVILSPSCPCRSPSTSLSPPRVAQTLPLFKFQLPSLIMLPCLIPPDRLLPPPPFSVSGKTLLPRPSHFLFPTRNERRLFPIFSTNLTRYPKVERTVSLLALNPSLNYSQSKLLLFRRWFSLPFTFTHPGIRPESLVSFMTEIR